jgi:thiamine pyrophosphate-dependent acetolactate synthase large subunit-like protein
VTVTDALHASEHPLTHAQLAHLVHGVPVSDAGLSLAEAKQRKDAIRAVQKEIESLRRRDVPIIPAGRGMSLARTPQEAREGAERIRRSIHTMRETAAALERWADANEQTGQLSWMEAAA